MPTTMREDERAAIAWLRSPEAIRERCGNVLARGLDGRLDWFAVHVDRLPEVASRVLEVTRATYPDLSAIPYHSRWNHFRAGGVDRVAAFDQELEALDPDERARTRFDLVVTSVLLDAGAGAQWVYREPETGLALGRSEGLAIASLHAFLEGAFSSDPSAPWRADATGLAAVTPAVVARAFQVDARTNPIVGLDGRASLLGRLGDALRGTPEIFGAEGALGGPPRIGGMYDYLKQKADAEGGMLPAKAILAAVLEGLGSIWPGRLSLAGVNLGDVWPHRAAGGGGASAGLVPFHKLSQWLTYSLIEPLEQAGVVVVDVDALTGLAEYRNGGLFVDLGVLVPKADDVRERAFAPGDTLVVEWRALTVALLDRVADEVRRGLGLDRERLPLAKVLEGGTWAAGRLVARERRPDGSPPIAIDSDGTVF